MNIHAMWRCGLFPSQTKYRRLRGAAVSSCRFPVSAPFNGFCSLKGIKLSRLPCFFFTCWKGKFLLYETATEYLFGCKPVTNNSLWWWISFCFKLKVLIIFTFSFRLLNTCFVLGCVWRGGLRFPNGSYIFGVWVSPFNTPQWCSSSVMITDWSL